MPTEAVVYIATSLDGYISRKDGGLDWLDKANESAKGDDCGTAEFMESIDIIVLGRNTFEKVLTFGEWPYKAKPVIVLSSIKNYEIPTKFGNFVTHSAEDPQTLIDRLSNAGVKRIYVDGGVTIQRFLRAGLISELTITLIPVIIGEGIPLFATVEKDVSLTHIETKSFNFGFIQVKYKVNV
jgi:dihydrofolate reductase